MGSLYAFPVKRVGRPLPNSVRVAFDAGTWCVELRRGDRLFRRIVYPTEEAARGEAKRLAGTGLRLLRSTYGL